MDAFWGLKGDLLTKFSGFENNKFRPPLFQIPTQKTKPHSKVSGIWTVRSIIRSNSPVAKSHSLSTICYHVSQILLFKVPIITYINNNILSINIEYHTGQRFFSAIFFSSLTLLYNADFNIGKCLLWESIGFLPSYTELLMNFQTVRAYISLDGLLDLVCY